MCEQYVVCVFTAVSVGVWPQGKTRWASAAAQSPVYLMRRPHAKLMWTSRSQGVHSEHAQISPRLQHTAANRTVLLDSVGLTVSSSQPDVILDSIWFSLGCANFKTSVLPASPFCFTDAVCVGEGIIMEEEGNYCFLNENKYCHGALCSLAIRWPQVENCLWIIVTAV